MQAFEHLKRVACNVLVKNTPVFWQKQPVLAAPQSQRGQALCVMSKLDPWGRDDNSSTKVWLAQIFSGPLDEQLGQAPESALSGDLTHGGQSSQQGKVFPGSSALDFST